MANYTSFNKDEIISISSRFNINNIDSFKILDGGLENSSYKITSKGKSYVLTICEQKSFKKAEELALLLEHLKQNNFYTSNVITNKNGSPILLWNNKPIMVKKYIEGKIEKKLSLNLLILIGEQIAKLHLVSPPSFLPDQVNYGKEKFEELKNYSNVSKFQTWLNKKIKYLNPFF
jgi:homoserine kinase type II